MIYRYTAPSGIEVESCKPCPPVDPWIRHGAFVYALYSWRHWAGVMWKGVKTMVKEHRAAATGVQK